MKPSWLSAFLSCALFFLPHSARASHPATAFDSPSSKKPLQQNATLEFSPLEKILPQMLDSAEVPGLAIAIVENGKPVWMRGFGFKNAATKAPVIESTIFQAASLSKPVFAYAVHKLVEEGKFDLDQPLLEYVPQAYFEAAFLKRPLDDERMRRLTARMVLSHTTGFPNWRRGEKGLQLNFEPGAHFNYSGEGFVLLQKVIERLTGQTLQEFVARQVFLPLGMAASSYVWRNEYAPDLAEPHDLLGKVEERPPTLEGNAAYSLYTTARDYGIFLAAMLEQRGLEKKTFAQMLKPQMQLPARWGDFSGAKAEGLSWGLGWGLQRTKVDESFWHWGDNGAYRCYVVDYPKQNRGLVFFTNSVRGLNMTAELVRQIGGDDHAALMQWLNYDSYNSASAILEKTARKNGMAAAIAQFRAQSKAKPNYRLNEGAVNSLGYLLMRGNRLDDALQVFQLNVEFFSDSWNVFDSYAEAQLRNGARRLAEENYAKSLAMNPDNAGAKQILQQLRSDRPRTGNAQFRLKGHASARLVTLAGDFNDWSALHTLFEKEGEDWTCRINLLPGKYFYKFVVDDKWITDPGNPNSEDDGNGNSNSVLVVK